VRAPLDAGLYDPAHAAALLGHVGHAPLTHVGLLPTHEWLRVLAFRGVHILALVVRVRAGRGRVGAAVEDLVSGGRAAQVREHTVLLGCICVYQHAVEVYLHCVEPLDVELHGHAVDPVLQSVNRREGLQVVLLLVGEDGLSLQLVDVRSDLVPIQVEAVKHQCEWLPQLQLLLVSVAIRWRDREDADACAEGLPDDEEDRAVLHFDVARPLQVEVVLSLVAARPVEHYGDQVPLEAVIVSGDVPVVFFLGELLLVELDLDADWLLAVAHVAALHIAEVQQVVELLIHGEVGYQGRLCGGGERLLVPADGGLREVYPWDQCLEGHIRAVNARHVGDGDGVESLLVELVLALEHRDRVVRAVAGLRADDLLHHLQAVALHTQGQHAPSQGVHSRECHSQVPVGAVVLGAQAAGGLGVHGKDRQPQGVAYRVGLGYQGVLKSGCLDGH
jgi:hypothetical protein